MPFHSHANQSHFNKNGFALKLALKQRHKATRKWPNFFWNSTVSKFDYDVVILPVDAAHLSI